MTATRQAPEKGADQSVRPKPQMLRPGSVLFLAPGDVAKGRVEPISWMQTCSAYAEHSERVVLGTVQVRRPDGADADRVWDHYGMEPDFRIRVFPSPLRRDPTLWWFRLWVGLAALTFSAGVAGAQAFRPRATVIHVRLPVSALPFLMLNLLLPASRRVRIVFETHSMPRSNHQWVVRRADLVVTNSDKLAADIQVRFRIPSQRVRHVPLPPYNPVKPHDKLEARAEVGVPERVVIACYAGKMTEEHNEFLLRSAAVLADQVPDFRFLLVGGNPEILEWTRKRAAELSVTGIVILTGFVPPAKVEWYQAAADVLVYHMPDSMQIFPYCTPAKGYEYQAAKRPIVATDIPLFEEVFGDDGDRAIRVSERTPEALAGGVIEALVLGDSGRAMTERAATWVETRTWERRTEAILEALGQ